MTGESTLLPEVAHFADVELWEEVEARTGLPSYTALRAALSERRIRQTASIVSQR